MASSDQRTADQRLMAMLDQIRDLADEQPGQPDQLLLILRELERLHRDLQDGSFRRTLPEDRLKLFTFLQSMERDGGWPYIPRLQLRTFIDLLGQDAFDAAA